MNSIRVASQRIFYAVAIVILALALILPGLASAAQVTTRSIELSSSSVSATNVTYKVSFTPANSAGAFVVDFCGNSPLIGQECTAPLGTGFTAAGAATTTPNFSIDSATATRVVVAGSMTAASPVSVDISTITNPSVAGPLYARVVTFANASAAGTSTPESLAGSIDEGGVAISITPTIGVSGLVLESITFCVAKETIAASCSGTLDAPEVKLGEEVGSIVALKPGELSEDSIFTQISTNAANGAVVRLKSTALDCGGLMRAGAPGACDILPALDDDIIPANNEAKFGVKTTTAAPVGANATGSLVPATGSFYNNSTYALNFVENNTGGITSPFGDAFLETAGEPVNNQNMELIFGATVSNDTPAGSYSTDLSLIAVGKF